MKKFLLILGMITCLVGLTACSNATTDTEQTVEFTQENAVSLVESFLYSMEEIIATGAQETASDNEVIIAAISNYEAAKAELGDYQAIGDCTYVMDGEDLTVTADVTYSLRNATVELIYEDNTLTSATTNVMYTFEESMIKAGLNTLMGMGTVFAVLILISAIISCFGLISKAQNSSSKKGEKKVEKAAAAVDNAVAQIAQNEAVQGDDLELVAVIAAAIAASEGAVSTDGYVVRSIRRIR